MIGGLLIHYARASFVITIISQMAKTILSFKKITYSPYYRHCRRCALPWPQPSISLQKPKNKRTNSRVPDYVPKAMPPNTWGLMYIPLSTGCCGLGKAYRQYSTVNVSSMVTLLAEKSERGSIRSTRCGLYPPPLGDENTGLSACKGGAYYMLYKKQNYKRNRKAVYILSTPHRVISFHPLSINASASLPANPYGIPDTEGLAAAAIAWTKP